MHKYGNCLSLSSVVCLQYIVYVFDFRISNETVVTIRYIQYLDAHSNLFDSNSAIIINNNIHVPCSMLHNKWNKWNSFQQIGTWFHLVYIAHCWLKMQTFFVISNFKQLFALFPLQLLKCKNQWQNPQWQNIQHSTLNGINWKEKPFNVIQIFQVSHDAERLRLR